MSSRVVVGVSEVDCSSTACVPGFSWRGLRWGRQRRLQHYILRARLMTLPHGALGAADSSPQVSAWLAVDLARWLLAPRCAAD